MSGYKSLAHLLTALADGAGSSSRHRVARIQRFVFRHPESHRAMIRQIVKQQQKHDAQCDARFLAERRNALAVFNAEKSKRKKVPA